MAHGQLSKQRILILDSSERIRRDLKAFLETSGKYAVVGEATNLREAIGLARLTRPEIVLVDVEISEGYALNLLRDLTALLPSTVRIVATHPDLDGYDRAVRAAGAAASVAKERLFEGLIPAIEEARDSGAPNWDEENFKRPKDSYSLPPNAWWRPRSWEEWTSGALTFGKALIVGAPTDANPPAHWWRYIEVIFAFLIVGVLLGYLGGGFDRASNFAKGTILITLLALAVAEFRQIRRLSAAKRSHKIGGRSTTRVPSLAQKNDEKGG